MLPRKSHTMVLFRGKNFSMRCLTWQSGFQTVTLMPLNCRSWFRNSLLSISTRTLLKRRTCRSSSTPQLIRQSLRFWNCVDPIRLFGSFSSNIVTRQLRLAIINNISFEKRIPQLYWEILFMFYNYFYLLFHLAVCHNLYFHKTILFSYLLMFPFYLY